MEHRVDEVARARHELHVVTSPPNSSGVLILQALAALEAAGVDDPLGEDAGTLRLGDGDRDRMLGDPRSTAFDPGEWLGGARIAALVADARRAANGHRPTAAVRRTPTPQGDTVAVVAWDGDGWAVSLIQSLFHSFSAQMLEPSTGVLLHNRGASFSLADGHPNVLEPGRRPAHTLMPILVDRGRRLVGVLGTMGGKVHAQIHVQVLLRLLEGVARRNRPSTPRAGPSAAWRSANVGRRPRRGAVRRVGRAALARATLRAITVPRGSEWLGRAQAIWLDGGLDAGSDFRADGAAAGRGLATPL